MIPFDVLVVGSGMYVTGRHTSGFGTVLPTLYKAFAAGVCRQIVIACTTEQSLQQAREKAAELSGVTNITPPVHFICSASSEAGATHLQALEKFPDIRAAIVSVPDELHFAITKDIVERGVHVLVVKPLVAKVSEHRELIELTQRHKVLGMVEFHKRYDEANLNLFRLVRNGTLGNLLNVQVNFRQRRNIPLTVFRSWVESADVFQYLGVHYVDLISWFAQAKACRVMSYGQKKFLQGQGLNICDTIWTNIEWQREDGTHFLSSHLSSWVDPENTSAMSDQSLEVIGTEGCWKSDQKDRGVTLVATGKSFEHINPYFSQFYPTISGDALEVSGYGPRSILQFLEDIVGIYRGALDLERIGGLRPTFAATFVATQVLEASRSSLGNNSAWALVS